MPRVAIYARYSSDNQREASIEDQVRLCRERAEKEGWHVVRVYSDQAMSGASMMRPGLQQLMHDALSGQTDLVLSEALDRISRDQEDIAGIYKRMQFAGVTLFTLSEGEISNLHIGLKGTMNAIFLKDLADKTRRGLRGRVEKGMSGGGNAYGYDVVKRVGDDGEYARGERRINEFEARVVQRIFSDYVRGISPRAIASALNKEGVTAPTGGEWGASTIYGNRERGTGILNNELYIGKLVWNRLRYMKDPSTGKRVSRPNPESQIVRQDVPELRIIDQSLWDRVKEIQGVYAPRGKTLQMLNRPKNLLSGLTKCGCCGGGFTVTNGDRVACATSRNKGTCPNRRTMKRVELETLVLNAMRDQLMDPVLCEEFCKAYIEQSNELRRRHNASLAGYRAEYAKLEREKKKLTDSIIAGVPVELLKDRAVELQRRREELEELLATTHEAPVLFHPNMASRYHQEIRELLTSLEDPTFRSEASTILRSLIDKIILSPREGGSGLSVDLVGDLAGILTIATKRDRITVERELSRIQQVNELEASGEDQQGIESAENSEILAMVAGNRSTHSDFNALTAGNTTKVPAMVAGGHPVHQNEKSRDDALPFSAVVAGARFELTTFRL